MAYLSLYRKYRSQTFGDLIGQDHVVRTLQNAIASGRIAHSYLFTGPRGTGKTSTARLLAKALCCENGPSAEPDNECMICKEISEGSFIDVLEMDAASESGVDNIREKIVEVSEYRPMVARYKVFIIDEVHDLSGKAFDALLKTIEEPPPHIIFILATTEYNKVPPTIRSRCQKFEFHRGSMRDLIERLNFVANAEGVTAEPQAISAIARMADGGYRDALTLLEQAILTSEGAITLEQVYDQLGLVPEDTVDALLQAMSAQDVPKILAVAEEVSRRGRDPRALLESMLHRLSDLTRASFQLDGESGEDASREASLHELAAVLGRDFVLEKRGSLAEAHRLIRDVSLPRLWLESELIRISLRAPEPTPVPAPAPAKPKRVAEAPTSTVSGQQQSATPKVAPAPNQDTEGPSGVWARVLSSLPIDGENVPALTRKAREGVFHSLDGTTLVIELPRQMDLDWFTENPKRITHIRKLVEEHGGAGWSVQFRLRPKNGKPEEAVAVELPAEGQRLDQIAREVFAANDPA